MLEFNLSSCHVAYQISATDQMFWFASMLLCFSISLLLCCFICFSASQIQCLSDWVSECLLACPCSTQKAPPERHQAENHKAKKPASKESQSQAHSGPIVFLESIHYGHDAIIWLKDPHDIVLCIETGVCPPCPGWFRTVCQHLTRSLPGFSNLGTWIAEENILKEEN